MATSSGSAAIGVLGDVNCDVTKSELGLCLCELDSWLMGPEGWQTEGHGVVLCGVVVVVLIRRHDCCSQAPCRWSPSRRSPCRSWLPLLNVEKLPSRSLGRCWRVGEAAVEAAGERMGSDSRGLRLRKCCRGE